MYDNVAFSFTFLHICLETRCMLVRILYWKWDSLFHN